MLVLFDGMDRTGKTSVALEMKYDKYFHNGKGERGALLKKYREQIEFAAKHPELLVVVDRSFVSEHVYGALYRGGGLTAEEWREFIGLLKSVEHRVFVLCGSPDKIMNRSDGKSTFDQGSVAHGLRLAQKEDDLFWAAHVMMHSEGVRSWYALNISVEEVAGKVRAEVSA